MPPKYMDIFSWRISTRDELLSFIDSKKERLSKTEQPLKNNILAVREHLSPVDVFCYLEARFGEPNGFQNLLRRDSSDNLIHWDFHLKAGDEDIYISGASREIQFVLPANLTDEQWRDLILAIKADYKRVAKEKSTALKSLEKWVIFPNKFVAVAEICADLHGEIQDNMGGFHAYISRPRCGRYVPAVIL